MSFPQWATSTDKTQISATSIRHVLQGVKTALKAPDTLVQSLPAELWERREARWRNDAAICDQRTCTNDISRPFHEWRTDLNPARFPAGVAQLVGVTLAISLMREKSRLNVVLDAGSLDTVLAMVSDAVEAPKSGEVHFTVSRSAQGFLAVPLCSIITSEGRIDELWRLHVWLDDGKRGIDDGVKIHAHQPFGQAWILLGAGTNCSYELDEPADPSQTTHAIYALDYCSDDGKGRQSGYTTHQQKSTIVNTGHLVRVKEVGREKHKRDQSYCVAAGSYHSSVIPGGAFHATFFVFDSQRGYDAKAAVLGPKHGNTYEQPRDPAGRIARELVRVVIAARRKEQARDVLFGA